MIIHSLLPQGILQQINFVCTWVLPVILAVTGWIYALTSKNQKKILTMFFALISAGAMVFFGIMGVAVVLVAVGQLSLPKKQKKEAEES